MTLTPPQQTALGSLAKRLLHVLIVTSQLPFFVVQVWGEPLLETIIVTATRKEQSLASIPGNGDVVTEDELALIGHTHINEALARVAGVWISRGNGQEHLTALRSPVLTGAGACGAFLLAQDGVALRASGFCNVNELFEANTEQAARIEVVKGPGSALYGSNAMHGHINVISQPVLQKSHAAIELQAGPHDYSRLKFSVGAANLRMDANATHDGGFKDESGFDQQKMTLRYQYKTPRFDSITTFAFTNLNQETAGFVTGHLAYKNDGLRRHNPNPEAFRDSTSVRLQSRIAFRHSSGNELVITPYLRYTDMRFLQHFLPGQALEQNRHKSIGIQSLYSWGDRIEVMLGLDAEYTRGVLKEFQATPTISTSAFLVATIPPGIHYDYDVSAKTLAPFLQMNIPLTDRLSLIPGIRFDHMQYDYDNKALTGRSKDDGTPCGFGGCRFNRPADRKDRFNDVSPKLGMTYRTNEAGQLYGLIARGFRAPQATELYRLQNDQSVSRIDSVQLDSIELGIRGQWGQLGYDISVFLMHKDNFIFRDSNRINVDSGQTEHHGIEFGLQYQFSEKWSLAGNGTLARHRFANHQVVNGIDLEGKDIDTAPRVIASTRLKWQISEHANMELEWNHLDEYYTDAENLHVYEGHDLINLRTRLKLSENWQLTAKITNLLDEEYAERADFGFGSERYFVGEPVSLYLVLTGRLK